MISVTEDEKKYFRRKILKWGRENFVDFPWRSCKNRWHCLVVEIMLQRTRAEQVVSVFNEFCELYRTPKDYLNNSTNNVFATLGLPQREELLKQLAQRLVEIRKIPTLKNKLIELPGVGDYVASSFRSLHLCLRDSIIDSNIVRFYGRYFGFETHAETRRNKCFMEFTLDVLPERKIRAFNYALLDFSMNVCKPKPLCESCIFKKKCTYVK